MPTSPKNKNSEKNNKNSRVSKDKRFLEKKVALRLPVLLYFDDYQEIFDFDSVLYKLHKKFRVTELGIDLNNHRYVALVFFGKKPGKKTIKYLLEEDKVNLDESWKKEKDRLSK